MANNADKPWRVVNPHGITWMRGFTTELSAWNRIMASQRQIYEDVTVCKTRLLREGWKVKEVT